MPVPFKKRLDAMYERACVALEEKPNPKATNSEKLQEIAMHMVLLEDKIADAIRLLERL
jgi:hypothetical protein